MGNCSSSTLPLDQSAPSAQDLINGGAKNWGDVIEIGCGMAGTVSNTVSCPAGFQQIGEGGSCHYCTGKVGTATDSSSGCGADGCSIIGSRLQCKLVQHNGDPLECCLSGNSSKGSCDPKYTNKTGCSDILKPYCAVGDRIKSDPACTSWASTVGMTNADISGLVAGYCTGANVKDPFCLNYCAKYNGPMCDKAVSSYCSANPTDTDFCGCYNLTKYKDVISALEAKGQTIIPWCNLQQCASNTNAYKPSSSANQQCPSQQICLQGIDLGSVGGNAAFSNATFTCNQTNNQPTPDPGSTSSTDQKITPTTDTGATPPATPTAASTTLNPVAPSAVPLTYQEQIIDYSKENPVMAIVGATVASVLLLIILILIVKALGR